MNCSCPIHCQHRGDPVPEVPRPRQMNGYWEWEVTVKMRNAYGYGPQIGDRVVAFHNADGRPNPPMVAKGIVSKIRVLSPAEGRQG